MIQINNKRFEKPTDIIYVGSTKIDEVYLGSQLIYPSIRTAWKSLSIGTSIFDQISATANKFIVFERDLTNNTGSIKQSADGKNWSLVQNTESQSSAPWKCDFIATNGTTIFWAVGNPATNYNYQSLNSGTSFTHNTIVWGNAYYLDCKWRSGKYWYAICKYSDQDIEFIIESINNSFDVFNAYILPVSYLSTYCYYGANYLFPSTSAGGAKYYRFTTDSWDVANFTALNYPGHVTNFALKGGTKGIVGGEGEIYYGTNNFNNLTKITDANILSWPHWKSIAYGADKWVITGYDDSTTPVTNKSVISHDNGVTWEFLDFDRTGLTDTDYFKKIAYCNNTFVALSNTNRINYLEIT